MGWLNCGIQRDIPACITHYLTVVAMFMLKYEKAAVMAAFSYFADALL
ncbi:hypothetical protein QP794_10710 [Paenibacillus sp. UMB7766-LJ446]|nr:hypothetical protein [Paenibacillus sp. UMB7766-LJ446]MDK8190558.1 hypothetical protein [Paenibacillus sp. UMB7766-LJ446]